MSASASSLMPARPRARKWTLALAGALAGLALGAWLLSVGRMDGMDAGPATDPGALGSYVVTWVVMMAAMMLPSMAPMVLVHGAREWRRTDASAAARAGASAAFVAGYLACWTAFGLWAYALDALVRGFDIGVLSWDRGGRYVAGAVIVAAGAYQLSPLKDACLGRCRAARAFVDRRWRDGAAGALLMGA